MIIGNSLEEIFSKTKGNPANLPPSKKIWELNDFAALDSLKITNLAYNKIRLVIQTAFKIKDYPVESYWFFIGEKNIVYDILVPSQTISHAFVEVSAESLIALKPDIQTNTFSILGWGHSHADFAVFFSGTDWVNQKRIFYETSNTVNITSHPPAMIKYSFGATFNIHQDKYCQITWQKIGGEIQHQKVPIEIIQDPNPISCDLDAFVENLREMF